MKSQEKYIRHTRTEQELLAEWYNNRSAEVRNEIFELYYPLLLKLSSANKRKYQISFEQALSDGAMAMVEAIDSYNPSKGMSLMSWLCLKVNFTVLDQVRRNVPSFRSRHMNSPNVQKVRRALDTLGLSTKDPLSDKDISDLTGLSCEDVKQALAQIVNRDNAIDPISASHPSGGTEEDLGDMEFVGSDNGDYLDKIVLDELSELVDTLPSREREIIVMRYWENMTFREIGSAIGLSQQQAHNIHTAACRRLKESRRLWMN